MKNINQMMKQAQQLQEKMAEMQERMNQVEMTGTSGGGMVKVTVNGKSELKGISIDPSLLDPKDVEVLEDLIIAAFNEAKIKIETHVAEEMGKITGGLGLPAGMKLPF
ncbi:MAG: YbaB/EbfC family nucleoid-associated protein [Alphaproteobacteria bacterium]|jgi:DNA-binding YbaB/EbfC family protein|nr:YbaB/EbfC family nucleoid-associated protein [Alphaproteobacteria bacterium]